MTRICRISKPRWISWPCHRARLALLRTPPVTALFALALLFAGCASHKTLIVSSPVGPNPQTQPSSGAPGTLVVYSARDPKSDILELPYLCPHSDYAIYSSSGSLVQKVHNSTDAVIERPANVPLPEGSYRVEARVKSGQKVIIPVVIQSGRVTAVHLEPGTSVQNDVALVQSNPVRLPTGEIVGWRADGEAQSKP